MTTTKPKPKKDKLSAAGRAKIVAAQKKRWAKYRRERGLWLSAAGRAEIVAVQKKRVAQSVATKSKQVKRIKK